MESYTFLKTSNDLADAFIYFQAFIILTILLDQHLSGQNLGIITFFVVFEVSSAHQGCIHLIEMQ